MEAVDHLGYQTIAIYPCSDPGYGVIIKVLSEYEGKPYFQLFKNIEFLDFWGLMNIANVFIGNSSAGVMEAASFKIPFVNIGIRQEGRLRADNVIDVDHRKDQIIEAIQTAVNDKKFREKVNNCVSPYGDGKASEKIVSVLQNIEINENLIRKKMTY
jgi:UDP-N-acetylglucosamine 2-epimerase